MKLGTELNKFNEIRKKVLYKKYKRIILHNNIQKK